MSKKPDMTLAEWMAKSGRSAQQVADEIGTTRQTVTRWRECISVPRRDAMDRIMKMTGGRVSPDSFYRSETAA